jgi:hypothetical protein
MDLIFTSNLKRKARQIYSILSIIASWIGANTKTLSQKLRQTDYASPI